jgi:hemoglobin
LEENEIFPAVGVDGFTRLVAAFYRRVPGDDILGPMYPEHDLAGAEKRLRDFLIYRFGGPQTYIEERGHPRLRMRHNPFVIDEAARNRWMKLMTEAMQETQIDPAAGELMMAFFAHMATFMINRDQKLPMAH